MRSQEPRSTSSCAACKFLKRRCIPNCRFAPYFHANQPKKFAKVHRVFGASNVTKILNEVSEDQREEAVNSLVYEAELRLQDPVYGCMGVITSLQHKMVELQRDLIVARAQLSCYLDQQQSQKQQCFDTYFGTHGLAILQPNTSMIDGFFVDNTSSFDLLCTNFQLP